MHDEVMQVPDISKHGDAAIHHQGGLLMSINSSLGRRPSRPAYRSRYRRRDQESFHLEASKHLRNLVIALSVYLVLYGCIVLPWSFGARVQDLLDRAFSINYDWNTVKEQAVKVSSWRPGSVWPLTKKPAADLVLEPPLTGQVTSGFGARLNPLTKVAEQHTGIDLEGKVGAVIAAAGDGVVLSVGEENGYGKCIRIDHGNGIVTLYAHLLRDASLKPQELVTRGQTIGWVGNSGTSLGYHLHFEVIQNGQPIDPTLWIKF